ncbi:hypothetical protein BN1183_CK_00010, partial [Pantoea ananatis]
RCAVPSLLQDFCRTARTRRPWRGLTFRRRPVGSSGNPASAQRDGKAGPLPRFDNCMKTNACIASDARKASQLIAVHFFIFVRLPCLQF